jgi:hypothetical protein
VVASAPHEELTLSVYENNFVIESYENVILWLSWGRMTTEQFRTALQHRKKFVEKNPGKPFGQLVWSKIDKISSTTPEERQALQDIMRDTPPELLAQAIVIDGRPLLMTTTKLLFSGLRLVQARSFPIDFFSELQPAVQWLSERIGIDQENLLKAVRQAMEKRTS